MVEKQKKFCQLKNIYIYIYIIITMQVSFVIKKLFEMEGIPNKTIVIFFAEKTNDDIKKILLVFFLLTM